MTNQIKTWIYLIVLTCLIMFLGELVGGRQGLLAAFVLSLVVNFFSYFCSDKLILHTYGARLVEGIDPYGLQKLVAKLAERASIPKPDVYIIPSETPNAFATGRSPKHASVAATEGILRLLTKEELEGVLAHELSHVQQCDTLIMAIAACLGTTVMYLANALRWVPFFRADNDSENRNSFATSILIAIVAPFAAVLIQLALSRSREYLADAHGAEMTSNPQALATALWKIHNYSQALPMRATATTAHLFIVNPLFGGGINSLFSTHPPIEERIKKLIGRTL
jgi:heat shock protein HtpX